MIHLKYHSENFNGSLDFRSKFHENWRVELHLHEYSEILYCQEGEGEAWINGRRIPLHSGEFLWIPPNYVHQFSFPKAKVVCAVFSNDFIPLYAYATGGKRLVVSPVCAQELAEVLEGLPRLHREKILQIGGILYLLAQRVSEACPWEETKCTDGVLFQRVVTYLSTHYTEEIRLSSLANLFGYNEKYLSHALHSLTGVHFSQLLGFYRIEHAKGLLSRFPEKNITTVAMESGFKALNTFNREFKKNTGMTPGEYKRSFQ